MPYARKRSSYRGKARRSSRALSTRRIFNNKSAKAQASQIYALRKSVNRIARANRPEVKELSSQYDNRLFGSLSISTMASSFRFDGPLPSLGTGDNNRIGNIIKIMPLKWRMTLQYREVFDTLQQSTIWNIPPLPTNGFQIRFIVVQAKSASNEAPELTEILDSYNNSSDYLNSQAMLVQHFKTGITAKYEILHNKVYSVSKDNPQKALSLSIKPKIKTIRWEEGQTYPRGKIWLFALQGGAVFRKVIADPDNLYDYNAINMMYKSTQAYTDA